MRKVQVLSNTQNSRAVTPSKVIRNPAKQGRAVPKEEKGNFGDSRMVIRLNKQQYYFATRRTSKQTANKDFSKAMTTLGTEQVSCDSKPPFMPKTNSSHLYKETASSARHSFRRVLNEITGHKTSTLTHLDISKAGNLANDIIHDVCGAQSSSRKPKITCKPPLQRTVSSHREPSSIRVKRVVKANSHADLPRVERSYSPKNAKERHLSTILDKVKTSTGSLNGEPLSRTRITTACLKKKLSLGTVCP